MLSLYRRSAGLLLLLAVSTFPASADDFGNTYLTAHQLTLGVAVNGQNETAGDVDYFKFNATLNHLYTAKITNLAGLSDTVLRLWSSDGATLLVEKDEIGIGETIVWRAPGQGAYFLSVEQYFEDQTGGYTLTVTDGGVVVDDYGNTPATTQATLPTNGSVVPGDIEYAGDVDVFQLATLPDHFYRVETLLLDSGVDTVLRLYAGDGATVLAEDDQGGREANASRIIFGATLTGFYFAEVRLFFPDDVGGYAVSATDEGVPEVVIVDGSATAGTLVTRDDIAVYAFAGAAGDRLVFTVSAESQANAFQMSVLGPDARQTMFTHDFAQTPSATWLCPSDSVHYLVLEEPYQGGGYTLTIHNIGPQPPPVDVNGDGVVDPLDLLLVSLYWRQAVQ